MSIKYYKDKSGNAFKILELDEKWHGSIFNADIMRNIPNVKIRDDDVIICGFMRSGTHWTYEMTHMLIKGKSETVPKWKGGEQFEVTSEKDLDKIPSPRVLNSHLLFSELPRDVTNVRPKIIFLVRDPRDVAVSNYNVLMDIPEVWEYSGSWDDYLDLFVNGKVIYGSWFDYNEHWEDVIDSDRADILRIYYEDTHKNPLNTVRRLSDFLGLEKNEELFTAIVEKCAFNRMKEDKKEYTFKVESGENVTYRKGLVGDWKNWFTVAQCEMFDSLMGEKMTKSKLVQRYLH